MPFTNRSRGWISLAALLVVLVGCHQNPVLPDPTPQIPHTLRIIEPPNHSVVAEVFVVRVERVNVDGMLLFTLDKGSNACDGFGEVNSSNLPMEGSEITVTYIFRNEPFSICVTSSDKKIKSEEVFLTSHP